MRSALVVALGAVTLVAPSGRAASPEELTRRLSSPDARERRIAAEALGKQKVESAVPKLVALLADKDAGVRSAAADSLVRLAPKSVPALADSLASPDPSVRLLTLETLDEIGPTKALLGPLSAALRDKDVKVRILAAVLLGHIGADARPALPALFKAGTDTGNIGTVIRPYLPSGVTQAAVEAALKVDPDCAEALAKAVLPDLITALKSEHSAVVQTAGFAISELGRHAKPALPALTEAKKKADGFAAYAVKAAIKAAEGDPVKDQRAVIPDPKAPIEVRLKAIEELRLAEKPYGPAVELLTGAVSDADPRIRAAAADALGGLGEDAKAAVPSLLQRLGDGDLEDAAEKAGSGNRVPGALARIGTAAVPGLEGVLKDPARSAFVRFQALRTLSQLGIGARPALPTLEETLNDRYPAIAATAAGVYLYVGGDAAKAVPVLKSGLGSDSTFVAWIAARAAERAGPRAQGTVPSLTTLLSSGDEETRIAAARALSRMGPAARPAVKKMAGLLNADNGRQDYQVADALRRLGPDAVDAVPALAERVVNLEGFNSRPVLEALAAIGPDAKAAVPGMMKRVTVLEGTHLNGALDTLGRIGPGAAAAVPRAAAMLHHPNPSTREAAARALGGIGPAAREAVPRLKELLDDVSKEVRVWAGYALVRITGEGEPYIPTLLELWEDDRPARNRRSINKGMVRFDLAHAFERLGPQARPARDVLLAAVLDPTTSAGTRAHAARALGALREDAALIVPKLAAALDGPAPDLNAREARLCVIEALGLLGDRARPAEGRLRRLQEGSDDKIFEAATAALDQIVPRR